MGMIYIMIVVSLVVAVFFLVSFIWATKNGQFDDDYTPSVRVLFEDEVAIKNQNQQKDGNGNGTN
ncbi:MAG: cbb3-type cytochrome oxidase assembly protein CcoS [Flavobacteriia bacterium]|jgi:cbb3-type cytochrome oxidase maturation protein|nr:cbb3-type cytochrome oxidase assembly protein CcoS [Flavobacteriia bacterium]